MMKTKLTWDCPICLYPDCIITRGSPEDLKLAVASHIRLIHEEKAALQAVDKARLECQHTECSIGRKNHINKTIGSAELQLTGFDKILLSGMKVSID